MIIKSDSVSMASSHSYSEAIAQKTEVLEVSASKAGEVVLSEEGKSLAEQLSNYKKQMEKDQKDAKDANTMQSLRSWSMMIQIQKQESISSMGEMSAEDDVKLQLMQKMLEALQKRNGKYKGHKMQFHLPKGYNMPQRNNVGTAMAGTNQSLISSASGSTAAPTMNAGATGTTWTRITAASGFYAESETTQFQATGQAITADGRSINFGVNVEMSRSFCAAFDTLTKENYIKTDPLVINLDSNVASVSDQKFLFDLDSDGKKESISFVEGNSGFLALDKNEDGKINDGNELFGTKSGNGFADLAEYDKDKNGWIDEADDVFSKLRIWTKDENGNDRLLSLKQAGVGALYLGYADTEFSLKSMEDHKTNAVIASTGIYLKENGEAGTIQHVDLAV